MTLILASSSPRRRELLAQIGVPLILKTSAIDETPYANEAALDYVQRLALSKAQAIAMYEPANVVLGADTCLEFNGTILTKPIDTADAIRMLTALSGHTHCVHTAVALVRGAMSEVLVVSTAVTFASISVEQIAAYVASGEPMDKAGAYAIQGRGAVFVRHIAGSYSNVVGLPLHETAALLQKFDVPIWVAK